jgi:hypothetical protein
MMLPMPAEPSEYLPGFFFISSTSSISVGGSDGLAKNTSGLMQTEEIGVKSLIGS